jgi:hypothetical protein
MVIIGSGCVVVRVVVSVVGSRWGSGKDFRSAFFGINVRLFFTGMSGWM